MKPWIAENQLQWILDEVNYDASIFDPEVVTFLEWGAGGSSVWFHERILPNVRHVVIESDHDWAARVEEAGCPVTHTEVCHKRAEHGLECSCYEVDYICRPEAAEANVILVDGFTRGPCLAWVHAYAPPDTTVYVHDCEFAPFQWALQLPRFEVDQVLVSGSRGTNPGPMLRMVTRGEPWEEPWEREEKPWRGEP